VPDDPKRYEISEGAKAEVRARQLSLRGLYLDTIEVEPIPNVEKIDVTQDKLECRRSGKINEGPLSSKNP
jgi:hypothetical protein